MDPNDGMHYCLINQYQTLSFHPFCHRELATFFSSYFVVASLIFGILTFLRYIEFTDFSLISLSVEYWDPYFPDKLQTSTFFLLFLIHCHWNHGGHQVAQPRPRVDRA